MDNYTNSEPTATALTMSAPIVGAAKLTVKQAEQMLDAALSYAARGWLVFPAPADGSKKGTRSGNGGNRWDATREPEKVRQYFKRGTLLKNDVNLGIATGAESGIFVIEADTKEGHDVDGIAALAKLQAEHGQLPDTKTAVSPSGSLHYYFLHPGGGIKIKNSASEIARGVDVRGDGGMVLAAPSIRPGVGAYEWRNDLPVADAPAWLIEAARDTKADTPLLDDPIKHDNKNSGVMLDPASNAFEHPNNQQPPDEAEIAAALAVISADCSYRQWFEICAAVRHELGDDGFELFDRWSATSKAKYDKLTCRKKWKGVANVSEFTAGTIYHYADQANPNWRTEAPDSEEQAPGTEQCDPAKPSRTLAEVHEVFRRWLGDDYDLEALDAVLATAACERLPGDPAWLLVIAGSGNAKTETVQSLTGLGAMVISTITSDGALLSASSKKTRAKNATGGLLRKIGERGILVIKDVTSILSASREPRAAILAALREIHDGRWVRNVGTDGGLTLEWQGRLVVIGACTTAWDAAHSVVASMGDRFVTIRPDSRTGRINSGRQAMRNTGSEPTMRQEMADVVSGLIGNIASELYRLTEDDEDRIVRAAELVTLARTGIEFDYRGDVVDAHDPEAPTRLAKQLTQIMRGAMAIGMQHDNAMRMVIRCAKDSMPQLRLAVLLDVAEHESSPVIEVRRRLQKPRTTVDRTLQALQILGLLVCEETELKYGDKVIQHRRYKLAKDVNTAVLDLPVAAREPAAAAAASPSRFPPPLF